MTPDKDGWIKHDGGPCPVAMETWVQIREGEWEPQSVRRAILAAAGEAGNG